MGGSTSWNECHSSEILSHIKNEHTCRYELYWFIFIFSLHMSTIIRSIENNIQFIAYVHIVLLLSLFCWESSKKNIFYISWFEWNTPKQTQPHWLWITMTTISYTCLGEQLNYSYINLFTVHEVDIISIWLTDSATCPTQSKLVLYLLAQFS